MFFILTNNLLISASPVKSKSSFWYCCLVLSSPDKLAQGSASYKNSKYFISFSSFPYNLTIAWISSSLIWIPKLAMTYLNYFGLTLKCLCLSKS